MVASEIQEMCTGPEFVVGEIYGLRQWIYTPNTAPTYGAKLTPEEEAGLGDWPFRLRGHMGNTWLRASMVPDGHIMKCGSRFTETQHDIHFTPDMFSKTDVYASLHALIRQIVTQTKMVDMIIENRGVEHIDAMGLDRHTDQISLYMPSRFVYEQTEPYMRQAIGGLLSVIDEMRFRIPPGVCTTDRTSIEKFLIESGLTFTSLFVGPARGDGYRASSMRSFFQYLTEPFSATLFVDFPFPLHHDDPNKIRPDCTCGFYAYHNFEKLRENSTPYHQRKLYLEMPGAVSVFGVIKGYGDTVVGTHGFRSSKAEIVALTMPQSLVGHRGIGWTETETETETWESVQDYSSNKDTVHITKDTVRQDLASYTTTGTVFRTYEELIRAWRGGMFPGVQ